MEEETSADAMSVTVDPIRVTTGFDLSTSEVVLILCQGFSMRGSTSPLANMPPEMVRMIAKWFCLEQISYLFIAGFVTPPASPRVETRADTSAGPRADTSAGPPLLTRAIRLRHQPAPTTAQGGVARSFATLQ
jgi:hypothetical protein